MSKAETFHAYQPMGEMNTTPLIDVMLVLLIMFIMTIPVATHALTLDFPTTEPPIGIVELPDKNVVSVTASDQTLWNGVAVNDGQLATLLRRSRAMPVEPELQFRPDAAASYNAASHAIGIIKASGVAKFGMVGNERFIEFGKSASASVARNAR